MQKTKIISSRFGFSLLELLVVIGIIALLASLVMAAAFKAKGKALSVQCMSNLRQQGLRLQEFLAATREYPLSNNPLYSQGKYLDHKTTWLSAIFPDEMKRPVQDRFTKGILHCPSAFRPDEFPEDTGYLSYGYNSDGLVGRSSDLPLGLGGKGTEAATGPPIRENEVKNPSEMIAMGDGFIGWEKTIRDGKAKIGRMPTEDFFNSTRRASKRHSAKANIVFCDGHVEQKSLTALFFDKREEALRCWNRDDAAHAERLLP